jgi:hypothetical protein
LPTLGRPTITSDGSLDFMARRQFVRDQPATAS